jgi:hypothetical protein
MLRSVHAAGHWYSSGAVIGWTGVAVAAAIGIVSVVMWRLGLPRQLLVWAAEVTPLLAIKGWPQEEEWASSIKVILSGPTDADGQPFEREVANPHLLKLRVDSRSHRAIATSDFDSGKPLVFHLGTAQLITFVDVHGPAFAGECLTFVPAERTVMIEPMLIRRGELMRADIITAGRPEVTCEDKDNPLPNVVVRQAAWVGPRSEFSAFSALLMMIALFAAIMALVTNTSPWTWLAFVPMTAYISFMLWQNFQALWRR